MVLTLKLRGNPSSSQDSSFVGKVVFLINQQANASLQVDPKRRYDFNDWGFVNLIYKNSKPRRRSRDGRSRALAIYACRLPLP